MGWPIIVALSILSFIIIISIFMVAIYNTQKPKYKNVKLANILKERNFRVVFSLTTIPKRMTLLHETVADLLLSSIDADIIYVNIPYVNKRLGTEYIVSDEMLKLSRNPRVSLIRCEDYGPATKLIPTLNEETDPETLIITADDDIYYPSAYHEELLRSALSNPMVAFGYRGLRFSLMDVPIYLAAYEGSVDVIEGFTGAIYRRKFFKNFKIPEATSPCYFTDDIWISSQLSKHDIKRTLLLGEPHNIAMGRKGMPISQKNNMSEVDALHTQNHQGRNKSCYQEIKDLFMK